MAVVVRHTVAGTRTEASQELLKLLWLMKFSRSQLFSSQLLRSQLQLPLKPKVTEGKGSANACEAIRRKFRLWAMSRSHPPYDNPEQYSAISTLVFGSP